MTTIKTIITTMATSAAESARRRALEALGLYVLVCDECKRECWERCQQDDGQWLCIRCVEGLRIDAAFHLGIADGVCKQMGNTVKDHARAKQEWAAERAALMRQRDEVEKKAQDLGGKLLFANGELSAAKYEIRVSSQSALASKLAATAATLGSFQDSMAAWQVNHADLQKKYDAARAELATVTHERDAGVVRCVSCGGKCHDRRPLPGYTAACIVCHSELIDGMKEQEEELRTERDAVTAERDNLRQHVALTTRGDGLDDLRVRLANAAIAWGEVLDEDKAYYAEEDAGLLVDELAKAIRAKAEVTT